MNTKTLYSPVNQAELDLIMDLQYKAFPPRLAEQPIFYPVLNENYAIEITTKWNVPYYGSGYVTEFDVDADYLSQFEEKIVGGPQHVELWIPAEELENFNAHIVGTIRVSHSFPT
ncbi:MAG: hypothetical protein AAFY70_14005 [Bacteroidota bacterium]